MAVTLHGLDDSIDTGEDKLVEQSLSKREQDVIGQFVESVLLK
jgi:hypothetical protein